LATVLDSNIYLLHELHSCCSSLPLPCFILWAFKPICKRFSGRDKCHHTTFIFFLSTAVYYIFKIQEVSQTTVIACCILSVKQLCLTCRYVWWLLRSKEIDLMQRREGLCYLGLYFSLFFFGVLNFGINCLLISPEIISYFGDDILVWAPRRFTSRCQRFGETYFLLQR
jgi:hypothetical protein